MCDIGKPTKFINSIIIKIITKHDASKLSNF